MTTYDIVLPPPGSPLTAAGTLVQITASGSLPLAIIGFELNQTIQLVNTILRLELVQMTTPASGTAAVAAARGALVTAAPFTAIVATTGSFTDGTTTAVRRAYFGWNLVSGEIRYREVPDARITIPAAQSYALRLVNNPPGGGIDLSGTLLIGVKDY